MPCTSFRGRPPVRAAVVCVLALLLPGLAAADPLSLTESFATTTYRDAAATTAWWDTGAGRVTLGAYTPQLLAGIDTPGSARDVCVDGRFTFVADRAGGLRVFDTGVPGAPSFLGAYDPTTSVDAIDVDGNIAVVLESSTSAYYLRVINVANPAAPVIQGAVPFFPTFGEDVVIDGDLCLVAAGLGGLILVDLTSLTAPTIMSSYNTTGYTYGVAPYGRFAVVADGTAVIVVDISDRAAPVPVGSCPVASAVGVALSGHYAFVADGASGLVVVDLIDPSAPAVVATRSAPGAHAVAVDGDWAYVAAGRDGLHVFDIRDPAAPSRQLTMDTPGSASGVAIQGDLLHVADLGAGLTIYRIAELVTPPERVGRFVVDIGASALAIQGDVALVTTYGSAGALRSTLLLLDVSDPAAPVQLGDQWIGNSYVGQTVDVQAYGDRALVAWNWWSASNPDAQNARIESVDISDAAAPVSTTAAGWGEQVIRFTVRGGRLFAVGRARTTAAGLWIWDASDPDAMAGIATVPTMDRYAADIAFAGNHAFVVEPFADNNENLQVYDVTNPGLPNRVWHGYLTYGYGKTQFLPWGNHALCIGGLGVDIFDITAPAAPVYADVFLSPAGELRRTAWAGRYLATGYAYTYSRTFGLVDVSDPTSPVQLAQSTSSGYPTDVAVAGDHAFVTTTATNVGSGQGLDVYRIFDRGFDAGANVAQSLTLDSSPLPLYGARISTVQTGAIAWQLSANGGASWEDVVPGADWHRFQAAGSDLRWRAVLGAGTGGEPPSCSELVVEWYHTDAADAGDAGLPVRFALAGAGPNPFNARTTVAYDVPAGGGYVRIALHDLRGRRLCSLVEGVENAGRHEVTWDGRDDRGRALPGGTYVCLMQAPGCRESIKLSFVP